MSRFYRHRHSHRGLHTLAPLAPLAPPWHATTGPLPLKGGGGRQLSSLAAAPAMSPLVRMPPAPFTFPRLAAAVVVNGARRQHNTDDALQQRAHRRHVILRLYRRCCRLCHRWDDTDALYFLSMQNGLDLLRPSLRPALPQMIQRRAPPRDIIRTVFGFSLPTDTEKMHTWCLQAGFAFVRRASNSDSERQLLRPWASIATSAFTPLDAAILAAHMRLTLLPAGDCDGVADGGLGPTVRVGPSHGLSRPLADVMRAPFEAALLARVRPEQPPPSLDAFSEAVVVQVDALVERCRAAIPAKELRRPLVHARHIAQSVVDVLRWDLEMVAAPGIIDARLSCIDDVLARRCGSPRLIALLTAHVLTALGLRATVLCHQRLPLVCIFSRKDRRGGKLQLCIDVASVAIMGAAETRRALVAIDDDDIGPVALGTRLVDESTRVTAQAAAIMADIRSDPQLPLQAYTTYERAAAFIALL